MKKIIHVIIALDKFIPSMIKFINHNFDKQQHLFLVLSSKHDTYGSVDSDNIMFIKRKVRWFCLLKLMYQSRKIIIHGLWSPWLNRVLFFNPWLLKKCYWVMWGGDFYFPESHSWLKKQVMKRMGHFITYIKGDYELAKKWYGATGAYHECFMYPSNLYKEYRFDDIDHNVINIQIGNSADPTNNHMEIFDRLEQYKDEDIRLYVPLSYGDPSYAKEVIKKGKEIFGSKFCPITKFMLFEKYLNFLGEVDIAVFAHKRQQAMGNTIKLLGIGKKVYMRSDVTPWELFKSIDVHVYDINHLKLDAINVKIKNKNIKNIKKHFSEKQLIKQWQDIFND